MCCGYSLLPSVNKESAFAYGRAGESWVGKPNNTGRKKVESGRCHVAVEGERCHNLTGRPQPCGDAQINRSGLIQDVRGN